MKIPPTYGRRRARIEIIPLIDIVFFLLATFIMVSLSMVQNKGVSVNLPTATTGTVQKVEQTVLITVKANGELYVDKVKVGFSELGSALATVKGDEISVIINGDEAASFGQAVRVLDEVRRLGIQKVAIRTKT